MPSRTLVLSKHCTTFVISGTHQHRFQNSLSLPFRIGIAQQEQNLNGSMPTLGVRKSASLSCHTRCGWSFNSRIVTAVCSTSLSSTPLSPPKIDCTAVPLRRKLVEIFENISEIDYFPNNFCLTQRKQLQTSHVSLMMVCGQRFSMSDTKCSYK